MIIDQEGWKKSKNDEKATLEQPPVSGNIDMGYDEWEEWASSLEEGELLMEVEKEKLRDALQG